MDKKRNSFKENNIYKFLFYLTLVLCTYYILIYHFKIIPGTSSCWDFKSYYFASKTYFGRHNPYDITVVQQYGVESSLPFRYHPVTLYLFSFFNNWEQQQAKHIYNYIRIIFIFTTVFIWIKYVTKNFRLRFFLILIATFGFSALMLDIQAGNIAIFEVFFLTAAVIFLMKNKIVPYFVLVIFLSLFRIQNMFFLLIPLLYFNRKNLYLFILSLLFLLSLNAAWYFIIDPGIEKAYLAQILTAFDEQGVRSANLGILLLIKTFISPMIQSSETGFMYWDYLLYTVWVFIIVIPSLLVFLKIKDKISVLMAVTFFTFLYVIVTPRILEYQFVILIVPALFVLHYIIANTVLQFITTALICINIFGHYQIIVLTFLLFAVYFYYLYKISKADGVELSKHYRFPKPNLLA